MLQASQIDVEEAVVNGAPDLPSHPIALAWAKWVDDDNYVSQAWADVESGNEVAELGRYSPEVLRVGAIRARRSRTTAHQRLPLAAWVGACQGVVGASAPKQPVARDRAIRLVKQRRSSLGHLARAVQTFDDGTVELAFAVLEDRAENGVQDETRLRRLPAKWRVPPTGSLTGAPVIEAVPLEIAIVCLLSNTDVNWQFSSTPQGHVFASVSNGYTRQESERDYVSGLSTVIDTVSGVIERHRKGEGGRVFLTARHVECADCKRVVAWLNAPGLRQTAFQSCAGVRRR